MLEAKDLEMISGLLDKKFEVFEERMDQKIDKKFEVFEERMDQKIDKKFEVFEERMDQKIDKKFEVFEDHMDQKMEGKIAERIHESENMILEQLDCVQMKLMNRIDSLQQDVNELKTYYRIDRLEKDTIVMQREQLDNLEKRVARLEMKMA